MIVAFEGIDNSGKGTQLRLLTEVLNREKPGSAVVFRHPGEGGLNQELRKTLLRNDGSRHAIMAECLIFAADMANLVKFYVEPALAAGQIVILDRFWLSSVVYQGHCDGMDLGVVEDISLKAAFGVVPDITFVIDIPPATGLSRQQGVDGQYEAKLDVQTKCRNGYLLEAQKRRHQHVMVIDGNRDVDTVHRDVVQAFYNHSRGVYDK